MFVIAYNEQGRTVHAHELCATPELRAWARKSRFECVECTERHPVHICFRDMEKLGGRTSHGPAWWHHSAGGGGGGGGGGGESETHWHAKHILSEHVGRYSFVAKKCKSCERHSTVEAGADATGAVERQEKLVGGRSYRFDAVLLEGTRVRSVLEIWAKHETSEAKRAYCLEQGYTFGEFDAAHVVQQHEQSQGAPYRLQNLKIAYFECSECRECREEKVRIQEMLRVLRVEQEHEERERQHVESKRLAQERERQSAESKRLAQERKDFLILQARLAEEKHLALTHSRLERERFEHESTFNAESQGVLEKSRLSASLLGIEAECVRYAEGRRALNAVIARKTESAQCFEEERLAHNKLLALELDADSRRMKVVMLMRRMRVTETRYY